MKFCPRCNKTADDIEDKCSLCEATLVISEESISKEPIIEDEVEFKDQAVHVEYIILTGISILFFLPTGVLSLLFAVKAQTYAKSNNFDKAEECLRKSKNFLLATFIISVVLLIVNIS